jgi:Signal transduction histidine kinase
MSSSTNAAQIESIIASLKTNSDFADLSPEDLTWLAERMEDVRFAAGDVLGRKGDPIEHLNVILEGEIQVEFPEEPGTPRFIARKGQITGALPFSRLKNYIGTTRAALPLHVLRLHMQYFPELIQRIPVLGYRLVAVMSDRIRETTRQETQRDKLMALGKLSAGLAHELNNPAAAAQRAAKNLKEAMDNVRTASLKLLQHPLSNEQRMAVFAFERDVTDRVAEKSDSHLDPIALSDLEAELTECLEAHKVEEPWKIAGPLAEANADLDKMEELRANVGDDVLMDALRRVAAVVTIFRLIHEIDNSTKRISELVTAIKRYSYMDQASMQEIDIREDLDNTIKIFGHWLKKGITVTRDYDPELPKVCAYGSELNQVWTNLIDNAIGAMNGQGELRIRARRDLDAVCVEIGDSGPGIPAEIKSRIFDPFFTTKPVGEGTGLGLDTAMRIVQKHHGTIEVKSKPGETRFLVRIPLQQPRFHANNLPKQEQEAAS